MEHDGQAVKMTPELRRYEVRIEHPRLDGPLEMEFICSADGPMIERRAKTWAFHMYRDACFLDDDTAVTILGSRDL